MLKVQGLGLSFSKCEKAGSRHKDEGSGSLTCLKATRVQFLE